MSYISNGLTRNVQTLVLALVTALGVYNGPLVQSQTTVQHLSSSQLELRLEWEGALKDGEEWLIRNRQDHVRNWLQDYSHSGKRFGDTRHKIYKDG